MTSPEPGMTHHPKGTVISYVLVAIILLIVAVALPFALISMVRDVANEAGRVIVLPKASGAVGPTIIVHAQLINLNELEGTVQLRVSGAQACLPEFTCPNTTRVYFASGLPTTGRDVDTVPVQEALTFLPSTLAVNQLIRLPIEGDPIRYPFDRFHLFLGVYATTVAPDGTETPVLPQSKTGLVKLTLENRIPRIKVSPPQPQSLGIQLDFIQYFDSLTLSRPLYLQVLASLLVLLVAAAASYAVFMRPLDQLIINAGALVLGVWGIRAILLGTSLSVITLVDLSLSGVILMLLVAITVRTLWLLEDRSNLYFLRRRPRVNKDHKTE